jgi:hypothetical protein
MEESKITSDSTATKGPYRTAFSLRIRHPNIAPGQVTESLGIVPKLYHAVGERRQTPAGQMLDGVYAETYWLYRFPVGPEMTIEDGVEQAVATLLPKGNFFKDLVASGGSAELFIGVFLRRNMGVELNQGLLKRVTELNLNLSFDVYVPDGTD